MGQYENLVKALRHCVSDEKGVTKCAGCPYYPDITGCMDRLHTDAAAAIEELQAEVERLKDSNEELRERQTYIDHYGDKWLTSAKDVPTAAYEHGYADGMAEAKAQLPKRGKWVEDTTTYAGPGLSNYKCSLCGKICGTWRRGLEPSKLPNWCGNCGADMRAKMEVQDDKTGV